VDFSFTQEQEMWRNMLQDFTEKESGREYTRRRNPVENIHVCVTRKSTFRRNCGTPV